MTGLRIGVDIDDVIFPWYATAHEICVAAGITNDQAPTSWSPFVEYGCSADRWHDEIDIATLDGRLYRDPQPIPGAIAALEDLRAQGHTIHLTTARGFGQLGASVRRQTLGWLYAHDIPQDSLTFSKDKTLARVDVFADDAEHNIQALTAAGIPACLIDAAHNQTARHPWRAASLADFAQQIKDGYRQ